MANTRNYQTIDSSELEDARNSCASTNKNFEEFTLKEHDVSDIPADNGLFHSIGKVTIIKDNKEKTYSTGYGSKWPADFDADLKAGYFD